MYTKKEGRKEGRGYGGVLVVVSVREGGRGGGIPLKLAQVGSFREEEKV